MEQIQSYCKKKKKVKEIADTNVEKHKRELVDYSYQGVKRLFILAYYNTEGNKQVSIDCSKKCFLPRVKIKNYNIEIDGRNFYDQSILLSNMTKSEKYQQDKVMITRLVAYWILIILKKIAE